MTNRYKDKWIWNAMSPEREAVAKAQEALVAETGAEIRSSWIETDGGMMIHTLEAGEGEPLILLHGSGNSAADWIPLMRVPWTRRLIAVDRPGFGLSDPVEYHRDELRKTAVSVVTGLLDALELERADIVGSSGGSVWALWTALDQPHRVRRLALLGATPLLPGTSAPIPLRLMATPVVGTLLGRLMPAPSPESVTKMMGMMGEGETVGRYPKLIDVHVAAGSDPIASETAERELNALIRGLTGFRSRYVFTAGELSGIEHPTLLIWGDHDPIGGLDAARRATDAIPHAELTVLSTGHAPWWGEPDRSATLITEFLEAE
jgi:pimeloyl-ACP methyl ester carboxylesterase